jgi:hypothetical protein
VPVFIRREGGPGELVSIITLIRLHGLCGGEYKMIMNNLAGNGHGLL